ncbi:MAG: hypothetical protein JXR44_03180 [Thiotrichales bacterium]|nr:hypothetical protein [Thiotrichales bacterium]
MSELNELSMVLIALMAIIIILILVLGYRKKQKYLESAQKAKQEAQALRAHTRADPSRDAAKFENGKIIPSKNPFGKQSSATQMDREMLLENEHQPGILVPEIDPNQHELPFEHEHALSGLIEDEGLTAVMQTLEQPAQKNRALPETELPATMPAAPPLVEKPQADPVSPPATQSHSVVQSAPHSSEVLHSAESQREAEETLARQKRAYQTIMSSERAEPKTFVLIVLGSEEIQVTDIHQFMMANNLQRNYHGHYELRDNRGNRVLEVVSLLNPGTFPENPRILDTTPGVVMILDLPCAIPAAAAMHDFIQITRKLANRVKGQVLNELQHEVNEPYFRTLRDSALGYDSQKITELNPS